MGPIDVSWRYAHCVFRETTLTLLSEQENSTADFCKLCLETGEVIETLARENTKIPKKNKNQPCFSEQALLIWEIKCIMNTLQG